MIAAVMGSLRSVPRDRLAAAGAGRNAGRSGAGGVEAEAPQRRRDLRLGRRARRRRRGRPRRARAARGWRIARRGARAGRSGPCGRRAAPAAPRARRAGAGSAPAARRCAGGRGRRASATSRRGSRNGPAASMLADEGGELLEPGPAVGVLERACRPTSWRRWRAGGSGRLPRTASRARAASSLADGALAAAGDAHHHDVLQVRGAHSSHHPTSAKAKPMQPSSVSITVQVLRVVFSSISQEAPDQPEARVVDVAEHRRAAGDGDDEEAEVEAR